MTLEETVREMRRLGILHMATPELTVTLGPDPTPQKIDLAEQERLDAEERGPDGLTPSQQEMLYGTVFDGRTT